MTNTENDARRSPDEEQSPNQSAVPDVRSPRFHLAVLDDLVYPADGPGAVPLASFPDNRYPYAYPRDIACITRAWLAALRADVRPEHCRDEIVAAARFMLDVQDLSGRWRQRYALDGTDESIYVQEDNVGHGLRILAHAVVALDETDGVDAASDSFVADAVEAIDTAASHARSELFDPNAHLIESTTSIHEGRIESGYTLWVNAVFVAALRQANDALTRLPVETEVEEERIADLLRLLESGVERAFTSTPQVPRRYSPDGNVDTRPDVTLFAPYYFGLEDLFGAAAVDAAERAATALEDPRLGGLQRFMGFYRDYEVQQHGGNGPWMQYTAWHAQFRYDCDEPERGDAVLDTIERYVDEDGYIPEHLTTRARFESFMENEWHTRRDFEKEFDEAVLRDVPFDLIVEEARNMRDSYRRLADRVREDDVVGFARPLAWSHAEVLTALLRRED
ncbi:glucoamylase [Halomicrococcus sp. NG-SE-24]|uniref:glucoamylase n=1 Tax=Halomicrococcus sp. NG-SE-24 TaxID=3436928 RepID=UPI003D996117